MSIEEICEVADCARLKYRAKPWCVNHSRRARLYGDPLKVAPRRPRRGPPPCAVDECDRESDAKGYCSPHYHRFVRYGDPLGNGHRRGTCSVEDCPRPHYGHGWCQMHYHRVDRHGEPGIAGYIRPPYEPICKVEGCDGEHRSSGFCNAHYRRWKRHGTTDIKPPQYRRRHLHPQWRTSPGYLTLHRRIDRERGRARSHRCVDCGEQARQWAYDHSDPNERRSGSGASKGCLYSLNVWRYRPMCYRCHFRLDRAYRLEQQAKVRTVVVLARLVPRERETRKAA